MFFAYSLVSSCLGTLSDVIAFGCVCVDASPLACRIQVFCQLQHRQVVCVFLVPFKKEASWIAKIVKSFLNLVNHFAFCNLFNCLEILSGCCL